MQRGWSNSHSFPTLLSPTRSTFQFFFFIPEEQQNWTWFRHTIQPRLFLHFLEHWAGSLVILSERGRHGWDARGGWIHALRFAVGRIGTARRRGVEGDGNVKPFSGFSDNWMRRARCIATGFRNGIQRAKRGCVWKVAVGGEGRKGYARESFEKRREEKAVEVNFLAGWWEETNYFPSARSHDGFLRFRWRVGGCFLGIRARVWVFDGRDWFDWVAVDRVVDFLSERERKRERLIGWKDNEMLEWLMEIMNNLNFYKFTRVNKNFRLIFFLFVPLSSKITINFFYLTCHSCENNCMFR